MGDSIARMVTEARRKSSRHGYFCDGGLYDLERFVGTFDEYNPVTGKTENRMLSALAKEERNSKNRNHHHRNHNNNRNSNGHSYNCNKRRTIDVTPHNEKDSKLKRALLELLK